MLYFGGGDLASDVAKFHLEPASGVNFLFYFQLHLGLLEVDGHIERN